MSLNGQQKIRPDPRLSHKEYLGEWNKLIKHTDNNKRRRTDTLPLTEIKIGKLFNISCHSTKNVTLSYQFLWDYFSSWGNCASASLVVEGTL